MNYYNQYNAPIKFKGDIVITDPCYIVKEEKDSICKSMFPNYKCPYWKDYYPYGLDELKYPDLIKMNITLTNSIEDIAKAFSYMIEDSIKVDDYIKLQTNEIDELTFEVVHSPTYLTGKQAYDKDNEEYHSVPHDDWDYCNYGESMGVLGFTQSAVAGTLYGDWSCTTYEIKDENQKILSPKDTPLGEFCADAGLVGVFLVDEVMKYNPDAIKNLKSRPWCATFIDGFDGEITFEKIKQKSDEDEFLRLVGIGNINFITIETGV